MNKAVAIALTVALGNISAAHSGIYTDDMSRCLVEKSSKEDKATLVKWMFMAVSQNPAISSLSSATAADIDKANTAAGELFMRLLTETCVEKTKLALKYEGPLALQTSFSVLGQVATSELFADAKVKAVLEGLAQHVDKKKLESLKEDGP